jgi:dTDP-4-dehydrorhamnose reductase
MKIVSIYICHMKILLTGVNGLLGSQLVQLLLMQGYTVIGTGRGPDRRSFSNSAHYTYYETDICNDVSIQYIFEKETPDIVVHAAAMTQADECELHPEKCERVNVQATTQLLVSAETCGCHFIYLSTDFVFDGEKGDYTEIDEPCPLSIYGFSKLKSEAIVETSTVPWTIVRTCLVYGKVYESGRGNIISWVKQNLENNQSIKVVNDQWRTPTYVMDLASGILKIIQKRATGIYHIAGPDKLSPLLMAYKTADYFGFNKSLIIPVNASNFTQPARRPLLTGLNITKAIAELGYYAVGFEEGLHNMYA